MPIRFLFVLYALLFFPATLYADSLSLSGQASSSLSYKDKGEEKSSVGLRYIPEVSANKTLSDEINIDALLSAKEYTSAPLDSLDMLDVNEELKLYRAWLRLSTDQSELRAGRQKINFGPAKILRSLRWFDQIDPEDPLSLTDGVDALLLRHYFLDNSNIWLWGIDGNDNAKGVEIYKSDENKVEYGGRYQFNQPWCEIGLSYNQRDVDKEHWDEINDETLKNGEEHRYAIDGQFDIIIGAWFEAVAEQTKINSKKDEWRDLLTIGADYTLYQGIYILCEHSIQSIGQKIDSTDEQSKLSALSLSYSFGMIDSIRGIYYHDWRMEKSSYYADWQRTYDN
ncbi:hypothetical protein ACFL2A_07630, partial [Thermodesulfobacteriota bacterium]